MHTSARLASGDSDNNSFRQHRCQAGPQKQTRVVRPIPTSSTKKLSYSRSRDKKIRPTKHISSAEATRTLDNLWKMPLFPVPSIRLRGSSDRAEFVRPRYAKQHSRRHDSSATPRKARHPSSSRHHSHGMPSIHHEPPLLAPDYFEQPPKERPLYSVSPPRYSSLSVGGGWPVGHNPNQAFGRQMPSFQQHPDAMFRGGHATSTPRRSNSSSHRSVDGSLPPHDLVDEDTMMSGALQGTATNDTREKEMQEAQDYMLALAIQETEQNQPATATLPETLPPEPTAADIEASELDQAINESIASFANDRRRREHAGSSGRNRRMRTSRSPSPALQHHAASSLSSRASTPPPPSVEEVRDSDEDEPATLRRRHIDGPAHSSSTRAPLVENAHAHASPSLSRPSSSSSNSRRRVHWSDESRINTLTDLDITLTQHHLHRPLIEASKLGTKTKLQDVFNRM